MIGRRVFLSGAGSLVATIAADATAAAPSRSSRYLFSYFKNKDNGAAGARLAISPDGLRFDAVRGGESVITPSDAGNLMRDPCIAYDPRHDRYHMVWTMAWDGMSIGYASSPDLIKWSAQQAIPVMKDFPTVRNSWAPEVHFDDASRTFIIFWSSSVNRVTPNTPPDGEGNYDHRIYYTTTDDFISFSKTRILFDPGFSVIDATFARRGGKLYLIVKDERIRPEHKYLVWAEAETMTGPFGPVSPSFSPSWVEGPTATQIGRDTVVFFDRYTHNRYGAVATRDFRHWRDISHKIKMPAEASHGTVIQIPEKTYQGLRDYL